MSTRARSHFNFWPWIAVAALLAVFLPIHFWVQFSDEQAGREYDAAYRRQYALDRAARNTARAAWDRARAAGRGTFPSVQDACDALNGGKPFAAAPGDPENSTWTDAAGGGAKLLIADGQWKGVVSAATAFAFKATVPPRFFSHIDDARLPACVACYFAWFFLAMFFADNWPDTPRERAYYATHLLLLACTGALLAMIGPNYWRPWNHFFRDEPAGWGFAEIMVSLLLLAIALLPRRTRDTQPRCEKCRYLLVGNTSGVCPECGTGILPHVRYQIAGRAKKVSTHNV